MTPSSSTQSACAPQTTRQTFDAFIFDLDGTLLDTLPDLVDVTNKTLRHFGHPTHTEAEILGMVGNGLRSLISQALPQNLEEARVTEAVEFWKAEYDANGHNKTALYPGMRETLTTLKQRGVKLGVLSNKYHAGVVEVTKIYLDGLMDAALGEGPVPRKPDPTGLLKMAEDLAIDPARIAYIGDSDTDMDVAHNAGAFAIGVSWGYQPAERLVDHHAGAMINHPSELLDFCPVRIDE